MSGKTHPLTPLQSRKQLLVAESELNRVQLVQKFQTLTYEAQALASQARTLGAFASAAVALVNGVASFCRKKPAATVEKVSWWQTLVKGAGVAASFWTEFRPRTKN